jgi:hypothetical protein
VSRKGERAGASETATTFEPYGHMESVTASFYVEEVLRQLGAAGLSVVDIEDHSKPRCQRVLSDLLEWRDDCPNEAIAGLYDFRRYNLPQLVERLCSGKDARPRIEIGVLLNGVGNLIVSWYPAGFVYAGWRSLGTRHMVADALEPRTFSDPPDFLRFYDEAFAVGPNRPPNELMRIRGVGQLRPDIPRSDGQHHLHRMLLSAVWHSHQQLLRSLRRSFHVTELERFVLETREEASPEPFDPPGYAAVHVVGCRIQQQAS